MESNEKLLVDKVAYMTAEQQAQTLKFLEEITAEEKLEVPRIIFTCNNHICVMRVKSNRVARSLMLGSSPIKVIGEYLMAEHKLLVGEPTAQNLIESIGSFLPLPQEETYMVNGRHFETGLPVSEEISSVQVRGALTETLEGMIGNCLHPLNHIDLISHDQLTQSQIILRGTLKYLRGLDHRLQEATGLKVIVE